MSDERQQQSTMEATNREQRPQGSGRARRSLPVRALVAAGAVAATGMVIFVAARPLRAALHASTAAAQATPGSAINTEGVGAGETEAGNLVADAIRASAGADIALVPAAAFKPNASVPRPATGAQAVGLAQPADDTVVVLLLRGTQILEALERSVSLKPQARGAFLQVAGLRFVYDTRQAGGKRVVSATVNGAPLEAVKTYKVAVTRPLSKGQQGYFRIWDGREGQDTKKTIGGALRDFAAARGGQLSAPTDGRITQRG